MPAGIKIPPGDEGCRTNKSRMKTITRHGNSNTNPRGIEIDELPFNRMRRRKNANREGLRPFSRGPSSMGRLGALGSRFVMRWMKLMGAIGEVYVDDPAVVKSTDPEHQGQELWPRSQRREQGTGGGEWSAGTGSSSRRVQRRGKRSRRGHRLSDGVSLDEVDVGNRDLSRQKTSGRRNASFPPPTYPSQRPRWRMGRASGATQTTVVHDGVHRSEVEDMNRWRWMGGEGGKKKED